MKKKILLTGGSTPPNAWDVRVGTVINGVTGLLKVNCRNGATLSRFDQSEYPKSAAANNSTEVFTVPAHGWSTGQTVKIYYSTAPNGLLSGTLYYVKYLTTDTFQLTSTSGGATPISFTTNGLSVFVYKQGNGTTEIWDTIDDASGYASAIPAYTGWSSDNQCGGIDATNVAFVWKDVTTTGDGVTASTCTATPLSCSFKDKISGQEWHKADENIRGWNTALSFCDSLTYNGKTDWRLPTQKELLEAANHGIMSTADSISWITSANFLQLYWSASSHSSLSLAWSITPGTGYNYYDLKSNPARVICVRP